MDNSVISAFLITHQCILLDYCLEATINSALAFCDDIYINDGMSTDGTRDLLYNLRDAHGRDRVKLWEREWAHDRKMWTDEKNFLLDKISNNAYVFAIDADEVIHENDMPTIKQAVSHKCPAMSFDVIHFYGRPTHYIEGVNWYKQHTRLWHQSTGIKLVHMAGGCADDVMWPDGKPAHWWGAYRIGARIFHYGNCRDPRALGMKSKKADDLYQNSSEYVGGKVAEPRSFDYGFETSGAKPFTGTHPKYIEKWYNSHKDQPTKFDAGDNKTNKLWCM
jgi:hypothetical protein